MSTKELIDNYVNAICGGQYTPRTLRAAFRDVVKQVVEEMMGEEKSVDNSVLGQDFEEGYNQRIAEEKSTGENIIKSLE